MNNTENNIYSLIPYKNGVAWKRDTNGRLVVRTNTGQLIVLTKFGAEIFEFCTGKNTVSQIIQLIIARNQTLHAVQITNEILNFVSYMHSVGVLIMCHDDF